MIFHIRITHLFAVHVVALPMLRQTASSARTLVPICLVNPCSMRGAARPLGISWNMTHEYLPQVYPGAVSCPSVVDRSLEHAPNIYSSGGCCSLNIRSITRAPLFRWYSENMLGRVIAVSSIGAAIILAILLQMTKPATVGPLGILIVFILMYVSVLGALTFLMFGMSKLIVKLSSSVTIKRPLQPLSLKRSYYFSSVIGLAPVMIIGMQSVGEVGFYDFLLVVIFVCIGCIYIAKRTN